MNGSPNNPAPRRLLRLLRLLAVRCVRAVTPRGRAVGDEGFPLAIVIPLADGAAHEATKLQLEILRMFGRNPGLDAPPHITLKLGFLVTDFAPIETFVRQFAAEVGPLEISLRNFGFFDEGIWFLEVEPNPELERLRQRILNELSNRQGIHPQEIEGPQFHFHVTLAHGLSSPEFAELRKSCSSREFHFSFKAEHIDLLCHTGRQWVTYQRAKLKGNASIDTAANPLLYRRQFFLSTRVEAKLPGTRQSLAGGRYHVWAHPDLAFTHVERAGKSLTLLGFALDPDRPGDDDEAISWRLLEYAGSTAELVRATDALGGRWVLVVHDGGATRILQDATGQRQVYYVRDPGVEGMVCASEVSVMAKSLGWSMDPEALDFIRSRPPDDYEIYWMPGDTSLYAGIAALLPNHILTLSDRTYCRFPPLQPISPMEPPQALAEAVRLLRGQMGSARRRFPLAIPMTAGWDSRLVLALNETHAADLYAFTLAYPHLPVGSMDVVVPARLLEKLGIGHHVIPYPESLDAGFREIFRSNNASANNTYCGDIQALHEHYPPERVCVTGDAAEIVKCYYQRTRQGSQPVSAAELAEFSRLGKHPFVVQAFTRWLDGAQGTTMDLLDLFCWEQMAGRWQAKIRAEYDLVQESFAPLNNRRLLGILLAVAPGRRCAPDFAFFAELIEALWPEVLSEPINPPEPITASRRVLNVIKKTGIHKLVPHSTKEKVKGLLR